MSEITPLPRRPRTRLHVGATATAAAAAAAAVLLGVLSFTVGVGDGLVHAEQLDRVAAAEARSVIYAVVAGEDVPPTPQLPADARTELEVLAGVLRDRALATSTDTGASADLARLRELSTYRPPLTEDTVELASARGEQPLLAGERLDPEVLAAAASLVDPTSPRRPELLAPPPALEDERNDLSLLLAALLGTTGLAAAALATSSCCARRRYRHLPTEWDCADAEIQARAQSRHPQARLAEILAARLAELQALPPSPLREEAITRADELLLDLRDELRFLEADLGLDELPEVTDPPVLLSSDDERLCAILSEVEVFELERAPHPTRLTHSTTPAEASA